MGNLHLWRAAPDFGQPDVPVLIRLRLPVFSYPATVRASVDPIVASRIAAVLPGDYAFCRALPPRAPDRRGVSDNLSAFCNSDFTALRFCWRIWVLSTKFRYPMSKLLFKLRNVPDDEAEEVRALLSAHQIDFYETSAGNWGISLPALWVRDETQYSQARELLDVYQAERSAHVREEYARLKQEGKHKTVLDSFRENPFAFIAYLFIVYALLYLPYKIITGLSSQ